MKRFILVSLALFVSSCATGPRRPFLGPDGTPHELVSCDYGVKDCYEKARRVCGGNYKIVNTSSQANSDTNGNTYSTTSLLVKCESVGVSPASQQD